MSHDEEVDVHGWSLQWLREGWNTGVRRGSAEEADQKRLIEGVMQMTAAGGRASTVQLALLSTMIPNALGSRRDFYLLEVFSADSYLVCDAGLHHFDSDWNLCGEGD